MEIKKAQLLTIKEQFSKKINNISEELSLKEIQHGELKNILVSCVVRFSANLFDAVVEIGDVQHGFVVDEKEMQRVVFGEQESG